MSSDSLRWAASDTWVLTWRNLTVWRRVPAYLVFTVVQPMIFTLLDEPAFAFRACSPHGCAPPPAWDAPRSR